MKSLHLPQRHRSKNHPTISPPRPISTTRDDLSNLEDIPLSPLVAPGTISEGEKDGYKEGKNEERLYKGPLLLVLMLVLYLVLASVVVALNVLPLFASQNPNISRFHILRIYSGEGGDDETGFVQVNLYDTCVSKGSATITSDEDEDEDGDEHEDAETPVQGLMDCTPNDMSTPLFPDHSGTRSGTSPSSTPDKDTDTDAATEETSSPNPTLPSYPAAPPLHALHISTITFLSVSLLLTLPSITLRPVPILRTAPVLLSFVAVVTTMAEVGVVYVWVGEVEGVFLHLEAGGGDGVVGTNVLASTAGNKTTTLDMGGLSGTEDTDDTDDTEAKEGVMLRARTAFTKSVLEKRQEEAGGASTNTKLNNDPDNETAATDQPLGQSEQTDTTSTAHKAQETSTLAVNIVTGQTPTIIYTLLPLSILLALLQCYVLAIRVPRLEEEMDVESGDASFTDPTGGDGSGGYGTGAREAKSTDTTRKAHNGRGLGLGVATLAGGGLRHYDQDGDDAVSPISLSSSAPVAVEGSYGQDHYQQHEEYSQQQEPASPDGNEIFQVGDSDDDYEDERVVSSEEEGEQYQQQEYEQGQYEQQAGQRYDQQEYEEQHQYQEEEGQYQGQEEQQKNAGSGAYWDDEATVSQVPR